ncbi:Avr9/Cf-9 rapidly elicited protein [Trifolium medium]|uniref:Avr9/Cf-9 rapidly elicited protein n=1 Tax=Trifolium medium TaxID=97028 RepID=A0A392N3B1_9FABA|nr:Avr9/Cf-9 rapidly elicited protein [Trifolium medium]
MLPGRLRVKVRAKLKGRWAKGSEGSDGHKLAEGWREAVEELMEWLSPMAHDTIRWQKERHLEKTNFETKPTAMLLQTLHYSDLEKAETAIVEVLVGLSCIYWCERRV